MSKQALKIRNRIAALGAGSHEIISGTIVAGTVDVTNYTATVQPSDNSSPIEGVTLNAITTDGNGLISIPSDSSNVIIGSVDGPGEWCLIRASDLEKVIVTIDTVVCEINGTTVTLQNGSSLFNISDSVFKMNTASESLFELLKDCFTYITALTVPTSTGPSGVPINLSDFESLITRLNNLLTS